MANLQTATFGGGCFWCTEAVFLEVRGVENVVSGYAGGHVQNPTYEQVCGAKTGHAEVIQIEYDADQVSYEDLLEIFFQTHDPTTKDRQGNDVGPQYRSAIFYHTDEQKQAAESFIQKLTIPRCCWQDRVSAARRSGRCCSPFSRCGACGAGRRRTSRATGCWRRSWAWDSSC